MSHADKDISLRGEIMDKEYRCPVCNRLILKGKIVEIQTRCPKCKRMITLKG